MRYNLYAFDGAAITVSEAEALEIGCDGCGATWLHEALVGLLHPCPYCGADDLHFGVEAPLAEQAASYVRDVRGIVRGLWSGALDYDQAWSLFQDTVRIGLTRAWHEGAAACGILPSELTADERYAMQDAIFSETGYIGGFLTAIQQGSKANGGKLGPLMSRAAMWGNRYNDVVNRAKLSACGDQKMMWVLGATEKHCTSCLKVNGKVKRASQWEAAGIRPQSPALECGGWRCDCNLVPTDAPMSKGPLPSI